MRAAGPTAWTALLATSVAAILASCAGAQKPAEEATPTDTTAAAQPAEPPPAAPAPEPAPPAALEAAPPPAAGAADAAAPKGPRQKATPEVEARARAQFAQAVKLQAAGDLDGAAAAFEAVRRSGAELPWAGLNAGLLAERRGRDQAAVQAYQTTIEDFPGFAPAAQNLVRLWRRQGRPLAELEQELRSRLAGADGVALRVGLAEVLLAGAKNAEAEEECKKALKSDEKNVPAMIALAASYAARKRYELARMVLENARQVDAGDPAVWNRLGFIELALKHRPQAIEHFKTAASLRPDYPEAHANYGAILADADDFAGAAQELELAVKYAPAAAWAWLDLGNARRGLQEFAAAEAAYRKALQLDPALNDARFNLALLYLDVPSPALSTLQRLEQGLGWFDEFEKNGGREPRVAGYRKDAARELDREKKRLEREEKDRLRKEAEARKRAEEEARRLEEARRAAAAAPATPPAPAAAPPASPTATAPAVPPAPADAAGGKLKEGGDR